MRKVCEFYKKFQKAFFTNRYEHDFVFIFFYITKL